MNTKYQWTKYSLILLFLNSLIIFAQENYQRYTFNTANHYKLFSARLLYSIDQKLHEGQDKFHFVYLSFENTPSVEELKILDRMGVWVDVERIIAPYPPRNYWSTVGKIPIDSLNALASLDFIKKIADAEAELQPQNNNALKASFADSVQAIGYAGNGVRIGILDTGLDVDYRGDELPLNLFAIDYSNYPYSTDFNVYNKVSSHGTNVTGVAMATGHFSKNNDINGGEPFKAPAYDAALSFFKISPDDKPSAPDAVVRAAAIDAVVEYGVDILSLSFGEDGIYHDGSSDLETTLSKLAIDNNVPIFISAGNYGHAPYHYSGKVSPKDTTDFIRVNVYDKSVPLDYNLVWDGTNDDTLELIYYNNQLEKHTDAHYYNATQSPRNTVSQISVAASNLVMQSNSFYIKVVNHGTNPIDYHIYKYSKGMISFYMPNYSYMTMKPSNADKVFSVGSYNTRNTWVDSKGEKVDFHNEVIGEVSDFSSRGPRIDGIQKPDLVAPGNFIISLRDRLFHTIEDAWWVAGNGSLGTNKFYYTTSGTSIATPHVAGVAAQILERYGKVHIDSLYKSLRLGATQDTFTRQTPNGMAGYGKLNAAASINHTSLPEAITILPFEKVTYCASDSIFVPIEIRGDFAEDNVFTLQLSGNTGLFNSPYTMAEVTASQLDTIKGKIPEFLINSEEYKIRVLATKPNVVSSLPSESLIITQIPSIKMTGKVDVCEGEGYQYSCLNLNNLNYYWEFENGTLVDSTRNSISIIWGQSILDGTLTVTAEEETSGCSKTEIYDISIHEKPNIFLVGDTIICNTDIHKYATFTQPDEREKWYVSNGTVKSKKDNSIEVVFDSYYNGSVELIVENDSCETRLELPVYNIQGEASEIHGDFKPARKQIYHYSVQEIDAVKTKWKVKGGEIIDSSKFQISVLWEALGKAEIEITRYTKDCEVTRYFDIVVSDEHRFSIAGKDTVCSESAHQYEIIPFDKNANYYFDISGGTLTDNQGDSIISVIWKTQQHSSIRVIKEISDITYIDTVYKHIYVIEKHGATISRIGGKEGFCSNAEPYKLIEGKPYGGKYYGRAVDNDGFFYPSKAGGMKSTNVYYVYPVDSECPDTVYVQVQLWGVPNAPELLDYGDYLIAHGATDIFNWYLNDELIEKGNGKHTPKKTGHYSVACITSQGCESDMSNKIFKEVKSDGVLDESSSWSIYPNPAQNNLTIDCKLSSLYDITIFDMKAKVHIEKEKCSGITNIDTSALTAGTYFVKLQFTDSFSIKKVVIE